MTSSTDEDGHFPEKTQDFSLPLGTEIHWFVHNSLTVGNLVFLF